MYLDGRVGPTFLQVTETLSSFPTFWLFLGICGLLFKSPIKATFFKSWAQGSFLIYPPPQQKKEKGKKSPFSCSCFRTLLIPIFFSAGLGFVRFWFKVYIDLYVFCASFVDINLFCAGKVSILQCNWRPARFPPRCTGRPSPRTPCTRSTSRGSSRSSGTRITRSCSRTRSTASAWPPPRGFCSAERGRGRGPSAHAFVIENGMFSGSTLQD